MEMKPREMSIVRIHYCQDSESSDPVRAGHGNNHQFDEKFAAPQTSMNNIASQFGRYENAVCQQIQNKRIKLQGKLNRPRKNFLNSCKI